MPTGVPGRTAIVCTLDRATGESCGAKPAVTRSDIISSIDSIDGATGVVSENSAVVFRNALDSLNRHDLYS